MNEAMFKIGDKVKRSDHHNNDKVYEIDKVRFHNGAHIYHCAGQGWAQGWAWVAEFNIKKAILV